MSKDNLENIEKHLADCLELFLSTRQPIKTQELQDKLEKKLDQVLSLLESSRIDIGILIDSKIGLILYAIFTCCVLDWRTGVLTNNFIKKTRERLVRTLTALTLQLLGGLVKKPHSATQIFIDASLNESVQKLLKSPDQHRDVQEISLFIEPPQQLNPFRILDLKSPEDIRKSVSSPLSNISHRQAIDTQFDYGKAKRIFSSNLDHIENNSNQPSPDKEEGKLGKRTPQSPDSLMARDESLSRKSNCKVEKVRFVTSTNKMLKLTWNRSGLSNIGISSRKNSGQSHPEKHSSNKSNLVKAAEEAISSKMPIPLDDILGKVKHEDVSSERELEKYLRNTSGNLAVKFEGVDLPKIRKRVCRKLYNELANTFKINKNIAKTIALNLECKTKFNCEGRNADDQAYLALIKLLLRLFSVGFYHQEQISLRF